MTRADKIEAFHRAVVEEIGKESPEVVERLALRLSQLVNRWADS